MIERFRYRTSVLLVALLVLLVVHPILRESGRDGQGFAWVLVLVLLSGVYAVSRTRTSIVVGVVLAVPAIVAMLTVEESGQLVGTPLETLAMLVFFLFVNGNLARYVLRRGDVDLDRLAGAGSVYLLIAVCWSFMYQFLELVAPGSFQTPSEIITWNDFQYFSFTTITTLGYGDIVPSTPVARMLSTTEAVAGTFYMATLVARLASNYRHADERAERCEA